MGSVWVYVDLESPRGDLWFTIQSIPNLAHLVRVVRDWEPRKREPWEHE